MIQPELEGVAETLLPPLFGRAWETLQGGPLSDPEAVRIFLSLDYPFDEKFGEPAGFHASRALLIDGVVQDWSKRGPGQVVELGCGLETASSRSPTRPWVCVDVPEVIRIREALIDGAGVTTIGGDALDLAWADGLDASERTLVIAQGLLMYFEPTQVADLIRALAARFPRLELVFDTIAPHQRELTLRGARTFTGYQMPPMPWGVSGSEITDTLTAWVPALTVEAMTPFGPTRGSAAEEFATLLADPALRERYIPYVVHGALSNRA